MSRAIAIGEVRSFAACERLEEKLGDLAVVCGHLTIAVVADPERWLVTSFGALAGLNPSGVRERCLGEAAATARQIAGRMPAEVGVAHWAASCWRHAFAVLRGEHGDLDVHVIGLPRRSADRRLIARAGDRPAWRFSADGLARTAVFN